MLEVVAEPPRQAVEALRDVAGPGRRAAVRRPRARALPARLRRRALARRWAPRGAARDQISSIRPIAPSLEDVFIEKVMADGSGPAAEGDV